MYKPACAPLSWACVCDPPLSPAQGCFHVCECRYLAAEPQQIPPGAELSVWPEPRHVPAGRGPAPAHLAPSRAVPAALPVLLCPCGATRSAAGRAQPRCLRRGGPVGRPARGVCCRRLPRLGHAARRWLSTSRAVPLRQRPPRSAQQPAVAVSFSYPCQLRWDWPPWGDSCTTEQPHPCVHASGLPMSFPLSTKSLSAARLAQQPGEQRIHCGSWE